jgi:hypothetical protein
VPTPTPTPTPTKENTYCNEINNNNINFHLIKIFFGRSKRRWEDNIKNRTFKKWDMKE